MCQNMKKSSAPIPYHLPETIGKRGEHKKGRPHTRTRRFLSETTELAWWWDKFKFCDCGVDENEIGLHLVEFHKSGHNT